MMLKKIEEMLSAADASYRNGDREAAIASYVAVYRAAYGNGIAKAALARIAKELFGECIAIRDKGNVHGAIAMGVRARELHPESGEIADETERLLKMVISGRDMTRECLIFPDKSRAEKFYGDAIQRAIDFAVYGGVTGDILEFGVLAGWTARLYAERMREMQFLGDLYLFDSFAGLPRTKATIDANSYDVTRGIWADEMELPPDIIQHIGVPIEEHIVFRLSHVISRNRIHLRKGFFSESLRMPINTKAAIVHLDCDLYQSTIEVLNALHRDSVLQDGSVLMFDDWNCNRANPAFGQRRALKEFLDCNNERYSASEFFTYGFNCCAFILHDLKVTPGAQSATGAADDQKVEAPQ